MKRPNCADAKATRVLALVLALGFTSSALAAENLLWNATFNGRHDDNIGLAPDEKSKKDTITYGFSGGLTWLARQTATQDVSVSVQPYYDYVDNLEDLSNYGVTFGVVGEQRLNEDFTAPFVSINLQGKWQEYEDSEIRDGYVFEAEIAIGKQFNPYIGAQIGGRFRFQESTEDDPAGTLMGPGPGGPGPGGPMTANSDEVFDLQSAGGFVRVDFNPVPKTSVFIEYSYMTGDVVATGDALAFNNPEAFDSARDFAFEEGIDYLAWRIDADQQIYSLGVSQVITEKLNLDVTASYLDAEGEFDNNYENEILNVGLTWNF